MGNRTVLGLKASKHAANTIYVYQHWSASRNGYDDAYEPLVHAQPRWDDVPYANRMVISQIVSDDVMGDKNYGVMINEIPWIDYEVFATICWEEQVVQICEAQSKKLLSEFTFSEYIAYCEKKELEQEHVRRSTFAMRQFSHGTLNPRHLLEAALPFVCEATRKEIEEELAKPYSIEQDAILVELWYDQVFDELAHLAPTGFYFGTTEGDDSDLGWWQVTEEV